MVYSKMLFWLPVGMAIAFIMIYMYMTTRSDSGMSAAFTRDEAKAFIENDLWFFILMSFVISLAGNMTILKQVIRSNRIRNRNW